MIARLWSDEIQHLRDHPHVYRKLPCRADDFVPLSRILSVPYVPIVAADSNSRSLQDLPRAATARDGTMTHASTGVGGGNHVAIAWLSNAAGGSPAEFQQFLLEDSKAGEQVAEDNHVTIES